jgi:pyroglutamyl-peptidase
VKRILVTAFEPYDRWSANSSWLALVEFMRYYAGPAELTTRRYPVDLTGMSERLQTDLKQNFDVAIHLGQSPGSPLIKLEAVGINVRSDGTPLLIDAPAAYHSRLPLTVYQREMTRAGIPARISHHAGTYLCNAVLYLSQHYATMSGMRTEATFIHLPLAPDQVAGCELEYASMSTPMAAAAIALVIRSLSE